MQIGLNNAPEGVTSAPWRCPGSLPGLGLRIAKGFPRFGEVVWHLKSWIFSMLKFKKVIKRQIKVGQVRAQPNTDEGTRKVLWRCFVEGRGFCWPEFTLDFRTIWYLHFMHSLNVLCICERYWLLDVQLNVPLQLSQDIILNWVSHVLVWCVDW